MSIAESGLSSLTVGEQVFVKFKRWEGGCRQPILLMLAVYEGNDGAKVICSGRDILFGDAVEIEAAKEILAGDEEKEQVVYVLTCEDPEGGKKKFEQTAGSKKAAVVKKGMVNQEFFSVDKKG